jgi:predicted nucleic acid-binding protein
MNLNEAILDDRAARKCAGIQRLTYRGTLGVILCAKNRGLVPAAKPVCDQLIQAGFAWTLTLPTGHSGG